MEYSTDIFVMIFVILHAFHGMEGKEIFSKALFDNEELNSTKSFGCKKADDVIHIIKSDVKEYLQAIPAKHVKRLSRSVAMPFIVTITRASNIKFPTKTKVENQKLEPKLPDAKSMDLMSFDSQSKPLQMSNLTQQIQQRILASVRKTQQLLQQKQEIYPAKERQKTRIIHTVIMNGANEHTNFQQGSNHKVHAENWQRSRARRELSDIDENQLKISNTLKKTNFSIHEGISLLIHLNSLLKIANLYLTEKENASRGNINCNNTDNKIFLEKLLDNTLTVTSIIKKKEIRNGVYNNTQRSTKNHFILMNIRKDEQNLLYNDVMTNIRNMIKEKNIKFN